MRGYKLKSYRNIFLFIAWMVLVLVFHKQTDTFNYSLIYFPDSSHWFEALKFFSSLTIYSFLLIAIPVMIYSFIINRFSKIEKNSNQTKNIKSQKRVQSDNIEEHINDAVLIDEFSKLTTKRLNYLKKLKDKNLKTVEKNKINKELELVNDELLRIDEILGQTRETLGERHLRVVDQGESIEAYGPEEFDRMEKIRRRNSKQGKALLDKINLQ